VDTETGYLCDVIVYLGKSEDNSKNETYIGMKTVFKLAEK
jgi:hypothetical protein